MKNFKQLKVWELARLVAAEVYLVCKELDREDGYIFSSQMTRAAISIPSNIAEGASRTSKKDFKRFLEIALGSSFELETQVLIFSDLGLSAGDDIKSILEKNDEVQKMLYGLIRTLRTHEN